MNKKGGSKITWLLKRMVQYLLLGLYKVSYGFFISIRYRLKLLPGSDMAIKGPYLLLGNHSNNFDGLFLQCLLPRPIHYLITDAMFRNKLLRPILALADFIPKKKFVSDIKAIHKAIRIVKSGGIVGIFPEGSRNWDGKTLHIDIPTFKLAKMLKVPVVAANIRGGYLSEPRWANTKRRGIIEVEIKRVIDAAQIISMSLDAIAGKIRKALEHDEFAWQRDRMIQFKGKALAEGFERLLYICPECLCMDTMSSKDDLINCKACGAVYKLDEYGFIHSEKGALPSENIIELNSWQSEQLKLKATILKNDDDIFIEDESACLLIAMDDNEPFRKIENGRLVLTENELRIGSTCFNIYDVYGLSVFFKSELSFRYKSCDYRIRFSSPRVSVYKWYKAIGVLKEKQEETV